METKSFSKYIAVLYCFETEVGKEILSGAIIKTNAQPDTQEIESIAHRVAQMTPMLKKCKKNIHYVRYFISIYRHNLCKY